MVPLPPHSKSTLPVGGEPVALTTEAVMVTGWP